MRAIIGSLAILVFLGLFGVKILIGFSVLVDKLRGGSPATQQANTVILQPPVLDPLPIATNSATLILTGKSTPKLTLIIYLNDTEGKKLTVPDDGNFKISDLSFKEGDNSVSAKVTDNKGGVSELSNVVTSTYSKNKPKLDVTSPGDNADLHGDPTTQITGTTDPDNTITINDRLAVVKSDGSFTYTIQLSNGDNTFKIIATDAAGNQTTVERHVTYER